MQNEKIVNCFLICPLNSIPNSMTAKKAIIWSLNGKLLTEVSLHGSTNQKTLDVRNFKPGTYIIELLSDKSRISMCKFEIVR